MGLYNLKAVKQKTYECTMHKLLIDEVDEDGYVTAMEYVLVLNSKGEIIEERLIDDEGYEQDTTTNPLLYNEVRAFARKTIKNKTAKQ